MKPDLWGPLLWGLLFDVAHYYRTISELRAQVAEFFLLLQDVVPCIECRQHCAHFMRYCGDNGLCPSDYGLFCMYPLKNAINRRLGKPELPVTVYLKRRQLFPICGSPNALEYLWTLFEQHEIGADVTLRLERINRWFELATQLCAPIPGYGARASFPVLEWNSVTPMGVERDFLREGAAATPGAG